MLRKVLFSVVFSLLYTTSSLACSSDCYQCHSNIPRDKEHSVLKSCTNCHPSHSERELNGRCGVDCFECHSIEKVRENSKAHRVLERCIECHKSLKPSECDEIYRELLK